MFRLGVGVSEDAVGETVHEVFCEPKDAQTGSKNRERNDEAVMSEEGKLKEIADEGDAVNDSHNTNNSKNQRGAKFVERARQPIDKDKVNGKRNKDRSGSKLGARKIVDVGDNREGSHADRHGEAHWEGILENVFDKAVFDAVGVFLESKDETWKTNTGEIKKRHFDGTEGVVDGEKNKNNSKDAGINSFGKKEGGGAFEVVDGLAALGDDVRDSFEIGI